MDDEKLWVYIGKGSFIDGVPARDLAAGDWARLDEDGRAAVEHSGLYRRARQAAEPVKDEGKVEGAKGAPGVKEKKE